MKYHFTYRFIKFCNVASSVLEERQSLSYRWLEKELLYMQYVMNVACGRRYQGTNLAVGRAPHRKQPLCCTLEAEAE